MSKFEDYRERLDNIAAGIKDDDTEEERQVKKLDAEALEAAGDALAFIEALWAAMGQPEEEDPDLNKMEALYDAYQGELAAASMFLSENTFARVPDMLRAISTQLEKTNDGSVPTVMVKGYRRFANRIEHTRRKKHEIVNALREIDQDVTKTT
jgi:hypothetical protein